MNKLGNKSNKMQNEENYLQKQTSANKEQE